MFVLGAPLSPSTPPSIPPPHPGRQARTHASAPPHASLALPPPTHPPCTHPRPRQVEDGIVVAQPLGARAGGRHASGARRARPGLRVQRQGQGRPARLHHGQASLLVGQGEEAAVAVTLGRRRGEEERVRNDRGETGPISEKTRAVRLAPSVSLTWLYLAQKAGVATPPGLTAMTPPPSAGSHEKDAM